MLLSKRKLALEIISDLFGEIVKIVASAILDTDECTYRALQRTVALNCGEDNKIPVKKIRQALLILLKHHFIIVECLPEEAHNATSQSKLELAGLVYRMDLDTVIRHIKYGQMLNYVSTNYNAVAEVMIELLMVHGSLTFNKLDEIITQEGRVDTTPEDMKATFNRLVQDRFIIGHPTLQVNTRAQAQAFQTTSAAARTITSILGSSAFLPGMPGSGPGRAASSSGSAGAAAAAAAVGVASAAVKKAPVKRGRKPAVAPEGESASMLPVELRAMAEAANKAATAATAKTNGADYFAEEDDAPAVKRRRGAPRSGGEETTTRVTAADIVNQTSRWRVGVEQFLKVQKHQVCCEFVQEQFAGYAEKIVKVVLKQSIQHEVDCRAPRSMTFSVLELQKMLKDSQQQQPQQQPVPTDLATLRELLDVLRHSSTKAILKVGGSEQDRSDVHSRFVVNYEGIFLSLRRRTIHSIAIGRFGPQSARILELLLRNSYLEQQQVTDKVILPARETRERLYSLFLNGWVSYQELSKRSDFSASSSAFFWYVDPVKLQQAVSDHLHKAMFNLLLRRQAEIKVFAAPILLSHEDEIVHRRHQQRIELLNFAEQQLDRTILILEQTLALTS